MRFSPLSFVLGLAAAALVPVISRGFRPLAVEAAAAGMGMMEDARRIVAEQMETLEYFTTFHGQSHPRAIELAEKLCAMFPPEYGLSHVMFSSGGSEANETSIKLARLYWAMRGEERRTAIVARHHAYHGLTIATGNDRRFRRPGLQVFNPFEEL